MSEIKRFEDLKVWQAARSLSKEIWVLTNSDPFKQNFVLRDQIDRASGSIMDNISEGYGREGRKEFRQYISVSKGSCAEVKSQLYHAYDRGFVSKTKFDELYDLTD